VPSICQRVLYAHSPFGHVARICGHEGAQTPVCPSHSPNPSSETARPVGCASAKVAGSQTDLLTPWHDGVPRSSLSGICRFSLEGKEYRTWGGTRVTCHPRENKYGYRNPPGPDCPHVVAPAAHQCPLHTPNGGTPLGAGIPLGTLLGVARSFDQGLRARGRGRERTQAKPGQREERRRRQKPG
jgi:hypothetical protein